jgi:hypothetical protein
VQVHCSINFAIFSLVCSFRVMASMRELLLAAAAACLLAGVAAASVTPGELPQTEEWLHARNDP